VGKNSIIMYHGLCFGMNMPGIWVFAGVKMVLLIPEKGGAP